MRLLISHKLFLALLSAITMVVIAALILTRWNFDRGFLDYVNAVEADRIALAGGTLTNIYAESNSWDTLLSNPERWRSIVDTYIGRAARGSAPPGPPPPPGRMRPHRPPPPNRAPEMVQPFDLLDASQQHLIGRHNAAPGSRLWPIEYANNVVGYLRYVPISAVTELSNAAERQFIEQQRSALFVTAGAALLVAGLLALLFGRRLVAPIRSLLAGTEEIASGHLDRQIPVTTHDELGQLAAAFNNMAATLALAQQTQRQWVADIAHELRTPVAILMGELQSVEDGVREWNTTTLASLQAEVERLTGLINDLHEMSLSEAGGIAYMRNTVDLRSILKSSLERHRTRFEQHALTLEANLPATAVELPGDARRLSQLCTNLLENCCRYTDTGGTVRVTLTNSNPLVLTVEDSAPGVPEEDLAHLFDRFFRVERSRNRASGGSGLGLAISKAIVEAHGGHINAAPSPLGGLAIRIELPRHDV